MPPEASSGLLLLAIVAPVLTGLVSLRVPKPFVTFRTLLAVSGPALSFVLVLVHVGEYGITPINAGPVAGTSEITWIDSLNLNLSFLTDGLGTFFALLVSGIGVLINLYARGYFGKDEHGQAELYRFYPTNGFFATAMLGIVLSDSMLLTLLFWEMTSISSFLLIGWDRYDKKAVRLAMQAFFTTGLGGMGLLGGILLFGDTTGIWRWSQLLSLSPGVLDMSISIGNPIMWAFVLMMVGAMTKSAQWPWHYWLPGAMAAPTPVSAFLHSATMVKAGVFLTGRLFPVMSNHELWPWLIIPIGAATMLLGAMIAVNQHDLKRIFAYTTVSQLGLLMCMYGLGSLEYHHAANIDFDITQIANHAFYKAPLFIVAGAIGHVLSRNITELHGAIKTNPGMCVTMLAAGYALAAGPGTISFQAKELFLYAVWHSGEAIGPWWMLLMAMTVVTAVCNVAIFVRLLTTLLGLPGSMGTQSSHHAVDAKQDAGHAHGAAHGGGHHDHHWEGGLGGALIWLPAVPLVAMQFIGGFGVGLWNSVFGLLETNANYEGFHGHVPSLVHALSNPGLPLAMSGVAVVGGVLLGLSRYLRKARIDYHDGVYPAMYGAAVGGGFRAFHFIQTGSLRQYMVMVLGAFTLAFAAAMWIDPAMISQGLKPFDRMFEFWPGLLLGLIVCASAVALPLIEARVVRVLLLGACGFSVLGLYIVYQAPDLALTQLMFEIISVILFVLVLRQLPAHEAKPRLQVWRAVISVVVALAMGWLTLVAVSTPQTHRLPELGHAFALNSYHGSELAPVDGSRGGGGTNIVNVILVDFRGFDTLGEITVLALAAMGVWSLMPGRPRKRPGTNADVPTNSPAEPHGSATSPETPYTHTPVDQRPGHA